MTDSYSTNRQGQIALTGEGANTEIKTLQSGIIRPIAVSGPRSQSETGSSQIGREITTCPRTQRITACTKTRRSLWCLEEAVITGRSFFPLNSFKRASIVFYSNLCPFPYSRCQGYLWKFSGIKVWKGLKRRWWQRALDQQKTFGCDSLRCKLSLFSKMENNPLPSTNNSAMRLTAQFRVFTTM